MQPVFPEVRRANYASSLEAMTRVRYKHVLSTYSGTSWDVPVHAADYAAAIEEGFDRVAQTDQDLFDPLLYQRSAMGRRVAGQHAIRCRRTRCHECSSTRDSYGHRPEARDQRQRLRPENSLRSTGGIGV